jgi:hypothetical protein
MSKRQERSANRYKLNSLKFNTVTANTWVTVDELHAWKYAPKMLNPIGIGLDGNRYYQLHDVSRKG